MLLVYLNPTICTNELVRSHISMCSCTLHSKITPLKQTKSVMPEYWESKCEKLLSKLPIF